MIALPALFRAAVGSLLELARTLLAENQLLRGKVDLQVRRFFGGQKNEALSAAQFELLLQGFTQELLATVPPPASAAKAESAAPKPAPRRPVRTGMPAHLPVRSTQTLIPAEVEAQPKVLAPWEPKVPPQSRPGKALAYGKGLWDGLCRYLGDGRVEIDDNVENVIQSSRLRFLCRDAGNAERRLGR